MATHPLSAAHEGRSSTARDLATEVEVDTLPSDEGVFLRARFGLGATPQTLAEIAASRGLSLEEAQRIEARALQRLRWRSLSAKAETDWDEV